MVAEFSHCRLFEITIGQIAAKISNRLFFLVQKLTIYFCTSLYVAGSTFLANEPASLASLKQVVVFVIFFQNFDTKIVPSVTRDLVE